MCRSTVHPSAPHGCCGFDGFGWGEKGVKTGVKRGVFGLKTGENGVGCGRARSFFISEIAGFVCEKTLFAGQGGCRLGSADFKMLVFAHGSLASIRLEHGGVAGSALG